MSMAWRQPVLPRRRPCLLDAGRGRDAAMDAICLPAVLHGLSGDPDRGARGGRHRWRIGAGYPALRRVAADAADAGDRVLRPLHRRLPGVRQHLCADRQRGRAAAPPRCRSTSTRPSSSRARSAGRSRPRCCCLPPSSAALRCSTARPPPESEPDAEALRWLVFWHRRSWP